VSAVTKRWKGVLAAGAGATGGPVQSHGRIARAQQEQQQQAQAAYQAQAQEFSRAFGACMTGRGYTVN
jgi:hypothetical protein